MNSFLVTNKFLNLGSSLGSKTMSFSHEHNQCSMNYELKTMIGDAVTCVIFPTDINNTAPSLFIHKFEHWLCVLSKYTMVLELHV